MVLGKLHGVGVMLATIPPQDSTQKLDIHSDWCFVRKDQLNGLALDVVPSFCIFAEPNKMRSH